MKGLQLPVNLLIIVVIAIIVLVAVIGMFYNPISSGANSVSIDVAKSQACRSLVVGYECSLSVTLDTIRVDNYDVDGNGNNNDDNLMDLCEEKFMIAAGDQAACRKLCGCAV